MLTSSITTTDGFRIVYDVIGEGSTILLLHGGGGGQTRKSWHEAGYVERLKNTFKVITMDIRGHGDSDKPTDPTAYTIDKLCNDVLTVADACDVDAFTLWGFSYGGNIGRYLAARSKRVVKLILMGIPFGLAASGEFHQFIKEFGVHWQPIIQAQQAGTLNLSTLSEEDREVMGMMDVPVTLAWLTAMLNWGMNEPADLFCPALWLSGSENEGTIASMEVYGETAVKSGIQIEVIEGLTHVQEFEKIDHVFPTMLTFTKTNV